MLVDGNSSPIRQSSISIAPPTMNVLTSFSRIIRQQINFSRLAALSLAVGLSSCANVVYPLNPPALQARGLQPGEGYIVASFHSDTIDGKGNPGSRGASATVIADGTGATKNTIACLVPQVMPVNRNPYLIGGGKPCEVIAIPVPSGDYEISRWMMTGSGSSGPVTIMTRKPLKVPFQVRPGEATYVGSFHSIALTGRNLLGFPVFADGMILATNEFSTDQGKIAKAYPFIKRDSIRNTNVPATYLSEMKRVADESRPWWKR
jgi:hypothetical protein